VVDVLLLLLLPLLVMPVPRATLQANLFAGLPTLVRASSNQRTSPR